MSAEGSEEPKNPSGRWISVSRVEDAITEATCADDCCAEASPGAARGYWIGMALLMGLITLGSVISALLR